jgi:hypothetical protein
LRRARRPGCVRRTRAPFVAIPRRKNLTKRGSAEMVVPMARPVALREGVTEAGALWALKEQTGDRKN